jgi:alanyl-tRNA synthetase
LKGKVGEGVIFLAGENNGKVQLVAFSTTDKFNAGELIRKFAPIVEGKGGGKADFAQGGGKNPEKIDQLLSAVKTHLLGKS